MGIVSVQGDSMSQKKAGGSLFTRLKWNGWRTATLELLKMADSFDEVVISVWRQTLVQNAMIVELEGKRYFVKRTSRHHFRQVDFTFNGQGLRGIEQNPEIRSRWAQLAREGKKVMQFLGKGATWL